MKKSEDKVLVAERNKNIQQLFRTEMGLIIDQPKQCGSGNSNNGNAAHRCFREPTKSSSITGID